MIRVLYLANPFDPHAVEYSEILHTPGMTAADGMPRRLALRDTLTLRVNGQPATLSTVLGDGDTLTVAAMPTGLELIPALAGTKVGSALVSVGSWWGAQAAAVKFIVGTIALNAAAKLLAPPPPGRRRGDQSSPTYGFNGPGNIRVEGQPIQIVYGRYRVPGTIINEFVRSFVSPPQSDYYALISFGEGPVHKIAGQSADTTRGQPIQTGGAFPRGIQLNGNEASELDDVSFAVRLGTIEQDVVSDDVLTFADTEQGVFIGSRLESVETASTNNAGVAFDNSTYTTTTADDHFDAYGVSYSFTTDFDAFRLLVNFPGGLYRINSSGSTTTSTITLALRYIELDGSGTPITSGGPSGDGYVRIPVELFVASIRSAFTIELSRIFYDPQTYLYPTGGRGLELDGTNDNATATAVVPTQWATVGSAIDEMFVGCWLRIDVVSPDRRLGVFDWLTSNRGIAVDIQQVTLAPLLAKHYSLRISIGTGTSTVSYTIDSSKLFEVASTFGWVYIAVSYTHSATGNRLKMWVRNSLVYNSSAPVTMVSPGSGSSIAIGSGTDYFDGTIDEFEWRRATVTPGEVSQRWAGGAGKYLFPDSRTVALYHFDATSSSVATDETGNNDLTLNSGADIPSTFNGKVFAASPSGAVPKRGRYRVDIVRVNDDSTAIEVSDEAVLSEVYGVINEEYSYPLSPLLALRVRASEQLNSAKPTTTAIVEGRTVPHWDGSFDFYDQWTRNPAWIALDLILSKRYGMGQQYDKDSVALQSFQDLADYSDQKVYDHQGRFDATGDWSDATYTGASGVGEIVFEFDPDAFASLRWTVGDYVGVSGAPIVSEDINSADFEGYTITAMDSAAYTVTVAVSLAGDPWTSGTALSASATVAGTLEGREARYTFDGVIDTARPAWEQLLDVLSVARAIPIREGKRIRVKFEHPRTAVDIVGQGSIAPDSFVVSYSGRSGRANSMVIEFNDEDLNYDRTAALLDHPSIQGVSTLDKVRSESISLWGCTRRSQALRQAAFLLNINEYIVREGRFLCSVEAMAWEVGDVLQVAHDVMPWGKSGRVYASDTDTDVQLGEPTTLAAATTYDLVIRNAVTGQYESREVTSSAGDYALGDPITVASAYSFTPTRDDVYILCVQGEERLIQITEISTTQKLDRDVGWIEYVADVYADDWFGDIDAETATDTPAPSPLMLPSDPSGVTVQEVATRGPGGNYTTTLQVSWEASTSSFVAGTAVHVSVDAGAFEQVAFAGGRASSVEVPLARGHRGQIIAVAVQPVTTAGVRRRPESCAGAAVTIQGVSTAPTAPLAVTGRADGDMASYVVTSNDYAFAREVRRGGWILGDPVVRLSPGQVESQSVANWASAFNTNVGRLYARAFNTAGFYSAAAELDASITPAGARTVPAWITAANINWAVYADGWRTASAPPSGDPVLTGFEVDADGALTFDGSALEATYDTAYTAPAPTNAIRAYVECWWQAEHEHPLPLEDWTWQLADPLYERWTLEGPMTVLDGETGNATLKAQIAIDDGTGFADWIDVRSGAIYSIMDAKFRLVATRPTTDYNIRVRRFVTRIRQQAFADTDTF